MNSDTKLPGREMVPLTPGIYPENFVPGGQPVPEIFGDKWWEVCVCVFLSVTQKYL